MEEVSPSQKNCQKFYYFDAESRRIWPRSGGSFDSIWCSVARRGQLALWSWGLQDSLPVTDSCFTGYGIHVRGSSLSSMVWCDKVSLWLSKGGIRDENIHNPLNVARFGVWLDHEKVTFEERLLLERIADSVARSSLTLNVRHWKKLHKFDRLHSYTSLTTFLPEFHLIIVRKHSIQISKALMSLERGLPFSSLGPSRLSAEKR